MLSWDLKMLHTIHNKLNGIWLVDHPVLCHPYEHNTFIHSFIRFCSYPYPNMLESPMWLQALASHTYHSHRQEGEGQIMLLVNHYHSHLAMVTHMTRVLANMIGMLECPSGSSIGYWCKERKVSGCCPSSSERRIRLVRAMCSKAKTVEELAILHWCLH